MLTPHDADVDGSDTENIDTNTDQAISHARSPPHSGPPTSFNQPTLPTQQLKDVLRPLHPDSIFPPINTDHLVPPPHPSQLPPAVPAPFTKIKGSNPGQMVVGGKVEIEIDWNFLGKKDGEMEILEFTSTGGRERWRIPLLSKRVYKSVRREERIGVLTCSLLKQSTNPRSCLCLCYSE